MVNRKKALIALICALTFIITAATGCSPVRILEKDQEQNQTQSLSGNKQDKDSEQEMPIAEAPTQIKLFSPLWGAPEPPPARNPVIERIEKYTNTKLEIEWVPSSAFVEKMNIKIATGDYPDVFHALNERSQRTITDAINAGVFWEIGPYLESYKNISALPEQIFSNMEFSGKVYSLPRLTAGAAAGFVVRKDWMDKVGINKLPDTWDEMYEMAKAFTQKDPDGNGMNDTYGFIDGAGSPGNNTETINWIISNFTRMGGWKIENDKFIPDYMIPEWLEAIKFYKKLYDDKLVNPDFATINASVRTQYFNQGKGGIVPAGPIHIWENYGSMIRKDPNMLTFVREIKNLKDGKYYVGFNPGYVGLYLFPKKSIKDEARLKKTLDFFDKCRDREIMDLLVKGIEGRHYTLKEGQYVYTDSEVKYEIEVNPYTSIVIGNVIMERFSVLPGPSGPKILESLDRNYKTINVNQNAALKLVNANPLPPGLKKPWEWAIQYIVGAIDEDKLKKEAQNFWDTYDSKVAADYEKQQAASN